MNLPMMYVPKEHQLTFKLAARGARTYAYLLSVHKVALYLYSQTLVVKEQAGGHTLRGVGRVAPTGLGCHSRAAEYAPARFE